MDDNKLFLKIIEERFARFQNNYSQDNGDFLSLEQQSLAMSFFRKNASQGAMLYGGYEDAERRIPLFMPDYTGVFNEDQAIEHFRSNPEECPLVVLNITVPRQEKVSPGHRDYLGALMAEGIRREKVGDILVHPDGAHIIALRDMAAYLKESLTSVGRASINTEILGIDKADPGEIIRKEMSFNVPSPRLDNVISAVFGISRKAALEAISKGLVFLDGVETAKPDVHPKEGQKLVLRGKGKAIYLGVTGNSRKGRDYISVQKYL